MNHGNNHKECIQILLKNFLRDVFRVNLIEAPDHDREGRSGVVDVMRESMCSKDGADRCKNVCLC